MGIFKKISPFERKDLFIAWIALAIAFTIALCTGVGGLVSYISNLVAGRPIDFNGMQLLIAFLAALIIVGLSFVGHELAHKFTAMHYGFWSEFRKSNPMLVMSVCLAALLGVVFAAPGATLISTDGKPLTKQQNGIISAAGPLTNIVLLIIFAALMIIGVALEGGNVIGGGFTYTMTPAGFLFYLGYSGWLVNAMFAFFNMLPVGPLDGKKIFKWNPLVFLILIAAAVFLLYIPFDYAMMSNIIHFFVPVA
ncbi:MAG TPA: peptidase M50 [Methanocorpusculum sp.]|nr:peptidase M50 [Methanocorpusculum sp.]